MSELKPLFTVENFEPTHQCKDYNDINWKDCIYVTNMGELHWCIVFLDGNVYTEGFEECRLKPKVEKRPWIAHELMAWQGYYKSKNKHKKLSIKVSKIDDGVVLADSGSPTVSYDIILFCEKFVAVDAEGNEHELYKEVDQ